MIRITLSNCFYFQLLVAFHLFQVSKHLKLLLCLNDKNGMSVNEFDSLAVLILLNCTVDAIHSAIYKAKPPDGLKYFFH